ncbi:Uncharacterised protein [Legionella birminghamensis]|uniref:Uncharacterized protein n=1 Tax=Legionella birminghamensis TaxID=28083 RepID=A0A378I7C1_9GAMM|nr:Uncharacterised protein [Legionella birminghamensis]
MHATHSFIHISPQTSSPAVTVVIGAIKNEVLLLLSLLH